MTELVERYRRNAEKCLRLVQSFNDLEARRSLLTMANAWLALAAQREKYIEATLRGEPASPINEPPTPPPIDEPKPPPIKEPPPAEEPPRRLSVGNSEDSVQS